MKIMKKSLIIVLLFIMISSFALAVDVSKINDSSKDESNIFDREVSFPDSFRFFNHEIQFPEESKFLESLFVGEDGKMMTWEELIVYIMIIALIFVVVLEILEFTAFETEWVKFLIASCLIVMIWIIGGIGMLVNLFYNSLNNFETIAIGLIILIVVLLVARPIFNMVRKQKKLDKAKEMGTKAGAALRGLKKTAESASENSKD